MVFFVVVIVTAFSREMLAKNAGVGGGGGSRACGIAGCRLCDADYTTGHDAAVAVQAEVAKPRMAHPKNRLCVDLWLVLSISWPGGELCSVLCEDCMGEANAAQFRRAVCTFPAGPAVILNASLIAQNDPGLGPHLFGVDAVTAASAGACGFCAAPDKPQRPVPGKTVGSGWRRAQRAHYAVIPARLDHASKTAGVSQSQGRVAASAQQR